MRRAEEIYEYCQQNADYVWLSLGAKIFGGMSLLIGLVAELEGKANEVLMIAGGAVVVLDMVVNELSLRINRGE